jgi:protein-S-isoprenylcysteine O-methyltransferase Ste14
MLSALELKMSPVMMTVLLALLMWILARIMPGYAMAPGLRLTLLLAFLGAGAAIGFAGVRAFHRARTTVNPWRPHATTALVLTGIYRRTRNPMYLALLLALAGWGLYLANLYTLPVAFSFVPYMNRFQIRPEERALEQAYGESFVEYCSRVRRWL